MDGKNNPAYKHGHTENGFSPTYYTWASMLTRCKNSNSYGYKYYGARGITVCERWMKFENFLADMGERPSKSHSLDRINNDGNYEPGNCRWATRSEQALNTGKTVTVTIGSETKPLKLWCEQFGVSINTVRDRVKYHGMSYVDAVTTPVQKQPFAKVLGDGKS